MHKHIRIPPDGRSEVGVKGEVETVVRNCMVPASQFIVHLGPADGHVLGGLQ